MAAATKGSRKGTMNGPPAWGALLGSVGRGDMSAATRGSLKGTMNGLPDWGLLLGSVLVFLFLYAPIVVLILFSFNSTRSTQAWSGLSFEWYGQLLGDPTILQAFKTSLVVGVIATLIATVIGTMTALALSARTTA